MAKYLVTGGAGFIGSNLARYLLTQGAQVVVFDNFSTGKRENLLEIADNIKVIEGDIRSLPALVESMIDCQGVFHLAALGSVPRSVDDPVTTHAINVQGTFHVLEAMRQTGIRRIVFSASSSAYGDQPISPKVETMPVLPISPYAASKVCGEVYMQAYAAAFGFEAVSLRYFNVFGPRQDPNGAYAAVIPAFVSAMLQGKSPIVYGDGEQTRDFCFIDNVCNANWLAMSAPASVCDGSPINIACHRPISLNQILVSLRELLHSDVVPHYESARTGDILHSLATIDKAKVTIGYEPMIQFDEGLQRSIRWYKEGKE